MPAIDIHNGEPGWSLDRGRLEALQGATGLPPEDSPVEASQGVEVCSRSIACTGGPAPFINGANAS